MLTRILGVSLLAGAVAGVISAGIQHYTTVPILLKAETYEKAEKASINDTGTNRISWSFGGAQVILAQAEIGSHDHAVDDHSAEAWAPEDGVERTLYTSLATVGTGVGFALILLAVMIVSGVPITARSGMLWGLGAFIATGLAPGLGLPPEIPGSAAAELASRQAWWLATAAATALGIWLLFRRSEPVAIVSAIVLIVAPHVIGAPEAEAFTSAAPAELAGHYASTSLAIQAVVWLLVGACVGYFWQRFEPASGELGS
jgi:cobalt transporter subunit CbtA